MKRRIKQIVLLALAVLAVVLIHKRVQKEAEEAEAERAAAAGQDEAVETDDAQSMSVIRLGDGVTQGRIEENTERGGIRVIVTAENGAETVYTFTDVSVEDWYANAVNFVVSAGLMTGVGDEPIFQPDYGMSRETFAAILYRFTHGTKVTPREQFDDVPADSWYYDAVSWVTNRRLMTALDTGVFGVGEYMTCEQALVGLYRVAGEPETDGALTDYPYASKVSDYGRDAIDWAWKNGLITEVECVWYPPQAISRAQVALLLMRYSEMSAQAS